MHEKKQIEMPDLMLCIMNMDDVYLKHPSVEHRPILSFECRLIYRPVLGRHVGLLSADCPYKVGCPETKTDPCNSSW